MPKEIRDLVKQRNKLRKDYSKADTRWVNETKRHRDALDYHEMELSRINKLRAKASVDHYKLLDDNHRAIILANKGRLTIAQLMAINENCNNV